MGTFALAHGSDPRWPQIRKLALADLEEGIKLNEKQPEALLVVAKLNLVLPDGDTQRASAAIDTVLKLSSDEPTMCAQALVLRAGTQKDLKKGLADLDEAVKASPKDPAALRVRAQVRAELQQFQPALDDLDKAIGCSRVIGN